jgi:acetyl-CoA carboxylase biotin carboxyl carrier protein
MVSGNRVQEIQQLIDILKRNELAELEWEGYGYRIRLKRDGAPSAASPVVRDSHPPLRESPAEKPAGSLPVDQPGSVTVTSPIVGTFYRSPSPDADPYVEEGDLVKKGQVLCIVEAMKLMNEIESEVDGRIIKILVESTKAVEYGQPLFLIDPASGA